LAGREDFRERFGRDAEGMWLPETAVDNESLEILAEAGMKFTILAPHQAWRVRKIGSSEPWEEVNDRIDPRRPYLWRGPGGATLTLFFYDRVSQNRRRWSRRTPLTTQRFQIWRRTTSRFKRWLDEQADAVLSKSPIGKQCTTRAQCPALICCGSESKIDFGLTLRIDCV
jgi:alpha-amylase/alpha-mannosidase (GH57 family)